MKTQINYSQINNINNNMLLHKRKNNTHTALKEQNNREQNYNRPARAISFGGSAGLKAGKKFINSTIEFVNENEAAYNAIYSLIVAGILKPIAVLNMPGSEEKDKQIVATKNFLQAFLGSFLSLTIGGGFIKKSIDIVKRNLKIIDDVTDEGKIKTIASDSQKALELAQEALIKEHSGIFAKFRQAKNNFNEKQGFDKITGFFKGLTSKIKYTPSINETVEKAGQLVENFNKNHIKTFESNPKFLKQLKDAKVAQGYNTSFADAFEVLWKNSTGALTAIGKAKISSLLLPGVMAFLFAKKNLEKAQQEQAEQNTLSSNATFKNEQAQFQRMLNKNSNVAFKGNLMNSAIDGFAGIVEKAGMSSVGAGLTKALAKAKKPSARMSDIESFAITGYWLQNTARSKKIEPSQKLGLNVHTALVTAVSSTTAFIIDWAMDGLIDKSKNNYKNKLNEIANSVKDMDHGETLDTVLHNKSHALRMEIKNQITNLLDSKETSEGLKEITNDEIKNIIANINKTKSFADAEISEELIQRAIDSLKKSEPIRKEIAKQCDDMVGAKDIAKKLSRAIGDEKTLAKEIDKLTSTYGKKLSKFKSLTIFTLVVRFLVPVLMVPVSGKLKKKIIEWTGGKADKK